MINTKGAFILACSLICFFGFPVHGFAQDDLIYGPEVFYRNTGKPVVETKTFEAEEGRAILTVTNGSESGEDRISSAVILLNDITVVGQNEFNQQVYLIKKSVYLDSENTLSVALTSAPGSYISISITREEAVPDAPAGRISGTVVDAQSGSAIEEARIVLDPLDYSAVTEADGSYIIKDVPVGTYSIMACAEGYISAVESDIEIPTDTTNDEPVIVDFALEPAEETGVGSINGTVTDSAGQPIGGASVSTSSGMYKVTTDENGSYVLELREGTHEIIASADSYDSSVATVEVEEGQTTTLNFTLIASELLSFGHAVGTFTDGVLRISQIGVRNFLGSYSDYWVDFLFNELNLSFDFTGNYGAGEYAGGVDEYDSPPRLVDFDNAEVEFEGNEMTIRHVSVGTDTLYWLEFEFYQEDLSFTFTGNFGEE